MEPKTVTNTDRYALRRFINRYNVHSYSHLVFYRSQVAFNLLSDIVDINAKKIALNKKKLSTSQNRFPAHDNKISEQCIVASPDVPVKQQDSIAAVSLPAVPKPENQ